MKHYAIHPSPEGDSVTITIVCGPLTPDHRVAIPTAELQESVAVARSRQLGVDARGDL